LPLPTAKQTADEAIARMRVDFRASRDRGYLNDPRATLGLLEHHYGESVADQHWLALAEMVRRSIEGFFNEAWLPLVRQIPAHDWLALEELLEFALAGDRVYVKMDLAFRRSDGGVTIVDWKTGRRTPRPDGLQLGVYALYAVEAWQLSPAEIQVVEVNLATRGTGSATVSDAQVANARETIGRAFVEMRAPLHDVGLNIARSEDFAPRPRPDSCPRCPFREVCNPTSEALVCGREDSARAK
jgi:hypothetical protein